MKKSFASSLILAILFLSIGAGLVVYSYNWNHKTYQWYLDRDWFHEGNPMSEVAHGFEYGYYDLALYGTPVCIALAVASFAVPANIRKKNQQALKEKEAEKRAFAKEHPHYEAELFYKNCLDSGISEIGSSAGRARLMLYVKNNGLSLSEAEAVQQYTLGQSEVQRLDDLKKQAEKAEHLRLLELQELNYEYTTTRFAGLFGQAKKVTMCQEKVDEYRRLVEDLDQQYRSAMQQGQDVYRATKQREGDWAVAGGIASGIAGPAAGAAAAVDMQIKNAGIRAQNEQLRTAINTVTAHSLMNISSQKNSAEKELAKWEQLAKKAELLLVQDLSGEQLLKELNPSLISAVQSDTGAVLIKAKFSAVHGAIYDNVSAVADGTIKAVLWEGNTRVGEALLTLPYDGAKTGGTTLEGICRSGPVAGKEYTVTFEPHKLWMIEG